MSDPCAIVSRVRGEPPFGTASRARRWLLLEQPGAWGHDALRGSELPSPVADRLARWSRDLPARVLLLRRPAGRRPRGRARTLFVGISTRTDRWLERLTLSDVDEILDLDLDALADGRSVGGDRVTRPLYLVCTNGKHDRCCARDGLPVVRELSTWLGDRVWECSHVGGDRFAGNLVCLPDGHFYGHLDAASARTVVAANEAGRIALDHWRGRSCLPFAVQAAESLLRSRIGLDVDADLQVVGYRADGTRHQVRFGRTDGTRIDTTVETTPGSQEMVLTCAGPPAAVPTYALVDMTVTPAS